MLLSERVKKLKNLCAGEGKEKCNCREWENPSGGESSVTLVRQIIVVPRDVDVQEILLVVVL